MFLWHLIFAIVIALLLSAIFGLGFRRTGAWPGIFIFFLIILLFSWAGGVWLAPFGPAIAGAYWLPFLFVGILIALFLAAAVPPDRTRRRTIEAPEQQVAESETVLGVFFWFLIVLLIIAITVYYI